MENYKQKYERHFGIKWNTNLYEVHHIDHNRENNDISNLVLLPKSLHQKLHSLNGFINAISDETLRDSIARAQRAACGGYESNDRMAYYELAEYADVLFQVRFWGYYKFFFYRNGNGEKMKLEGITYGD